MTITTAMAEYVHSGYFIFLLVISTIAIITSALSRPYLSLPSIYIFIGSTIFLWPAYSFLIEGGSFSEVPKFVSRMTLITLLMVSVLYWWKNKNYLLVINKKVYEILIFLLIFSFLSLVSALLTFNNDNNQKWLAFSFLTILFLWFSIASGITFNEDKILNKKIELLFLFLMWILIILIAGYEVLMDKAVVRNVFIANMIEARASSTFHNPNWFALSATIIFFLCMGDCIKKRYFWLLAAFSALLSISLYFSGSRSTILLMILTLSLWVVMLGMRALTSEYIKIWLALIFGSAIGIISIYGVAFIMGDLARERFMALIYRLMSTMKIAMDSIKNIGGVDSLHLSISGRIVYSEKLTDNAYYTLYSFNPTLLICLLIIFFCIGYQLILLKKQEERGGFTELRLATFFFVVISGVVGQVYWAFPVWIFYSALLGWIIHPILSRSIVNNLN
ncbi:hypothetical protein G6685_08950 [Polynucleobacter paneuropaeus]|jgi:hypothetical protein|nr:hypothetical protein [Polynucleobacter paneuropaeus]